MELPTSSLPDCIRSEVPADFFNSVINAIFLSYRETYKEITTKHDIPEASDLLPYARRARIEGELRRIAKEFPELEAAYEKNTAKNSWFTVIRTKTHSITLTISATRGPREMVRDARFRETLAETYQTTLFPSLQDEIIGTSFYGLILHGADEMDPSRPAFIRLGFPSRDCSEWIENIDLLRFSGIEYNRYVTPEETIPEEAFPVLRPQAKRQKK